MKSSGELMTFMSLIVGVIGNSILVFNKYKVKKNI